MPLDDTLVLFKHVVHGASIIRVNFDSPLLGFQTGIVAKTSLPRILYHRLISLPYRKGPCCRSGIFGSCPCILLDLSLLVLLSRAHQTWRLLHLLKAPEISDIATKHLSVASCIQNRIRVASGTIGAVASSSLLYAFCFQTSVQPWPLTWPVFLQLRNTMYNIRVKGLLAYVLGHTKGM